MHYLPYSGTPLQFVGEHANRWRKRAHHIPGGQKQPCVNADEALQFLGQYAGGWPGYVSVMALTLNGFAETQTVASDQIETLRPFIESRNAQRNLYFSINPLSTNQNKKAAKSDIAALAFLHADLDPRDGCDHRLERDRIKRQIEGFPIKPNLIIDSGGGFQVFWRLREPISVNGNIEQLESYNRRIAMLVGADHCWNIDRLMRLPGTVNLPNARKRAKGRRPAFAKVIRFDEGAYALDDFDALLDGAEGAQAQGTRAQPEITVDDLHVSSEIKRLIREGKPKGQHSEAIFKVIRAMVKAGHADTEISTILLDPANKLSEKPLEHGPAWLQAEINRARVKPDTEGQAANGKDASSTGKQNRPSADVVCLADVEPEEVEWLWHPYIPIGKVTSIEGDPGLGKSWLLMAIAAAISKGGEGLLGKPAAAPATCLLISAEDGLADTIRPRLDGLGADVNSIYAFDKMPIADEKGVALLEKHIGELRPALVVIDPLVAYMGGKIDMNKANQTRQIMAGLAQLAEKYRCAIVVLRHLSKGGQDKAIYRGIGSIDITAACRSVLLVAVDPNDGSRRMVAHIKSNLAANGQAIGFAIVDGEFQWHGYVDVTPEQMLAPDSVQNERRSALKEAEAFLCTVLEKGPRLMTEISELADQHGISHSTLRRAKRKLGIDSYKDGEAWFWTLPPKGANT